MADSKRRTSKSNKKTSTKRASTSKAGTKGARTKKASAQANAFPERLFAIAAPRSRTGASLFASGALATPETVDQLAADEDVVQLAAQRLEEAGFEILQVTSLMINFAGGRELFETSFDTELVAEERQTIKSRGKKAEATFFDSPDNDVPGLISTAGTAFDDVLDGVALEEPRYLMSPHPLPPAKGYWHLDVPGDVSLACNADRAHRLGVTGRGIRVAMVDSGWYPHPFFRSRGYRAREAVLGPGTSHPERDEIGHGTGESANVFAVAPDAELLPVKARLAGSLNTVLVNVTGAFNQAVALGPHVITNSWGFSLQNGPLSAAQQALAASVAAAVASNIVVVFSAGNGHWGFPGQHPDVISAGGVFLDEKGGLQASNYASGFESNLYPGRRVPDLSGLVGMRPSAAYIMLPVEPGDRLDTDLAGGSHPAQDETDPKDGWAAFSGTSAAAPQIAGAAALLLQACPDLTPAEVKSILMRSARDVTKGRNHPNFNHPAAEGPDLATGHGLVDAHRAVLVAKLRCASQTLQEPGTDASMMPLFPLQPIRPLWPIQPLRPLRPIRPIRPLWPIRPLLPLNPIRPLVPLRPLRPLQPIRPLRPLTPLLPLNPVRPLQPLHPLQPLQPLHPLQPIQPLQPLQPLRPLHPLHPLQPLQPLQPLRPLRPIEPIIPFGAQAGSPHPQDPGQYQDPYQEAPASADPYGGAGGEGGYYQDPSFQGAPEAPGSVRSGGLSAEDVQELENLILESVDPEL